jgi:ParB/RepB/Spo0J family partition protein
LSEIVKLPLEKIDPNPYQPDTRIHLTPDMQEFYAQSILKNGLIQTPVVRPAPFGKKGERYQTGDGWGRHEGFRWLVEHGHPEYGELPVEVREISDEQMADLVFEANGVRKDLNPIEKAEYFKKCIDDLKFTETQLAERHSLSQGEVANTLRLLQLPREVQSLVATGAVPQTHARHLLRLNTMPDEQKKVTAEVAKGSMTVNRLSEEVDSTLWHRSKSLNPKADDFERPLFDTKVCRDCESRVQATLPYGNKKKEDRCLKPECWEQKQNAAKKEISEKALDAAKKKGEDRILTPKTVPRGNYEFLETDGRVEFDHSECRTCEKRALFKYSLEDKEKPRPICLDTKCMAAKKSAFSREKNKAEKQADAEFTKRLGVVFHQAHAHPTAAMLLLARDALRGTQADDKRDLVRLFDLPKTPNGQLDTQATDLSLFEKSLEELQTDYADILLIHGTPGLQQMSVEQAMKIHAVLVKLRDERVTRFVGYSQASDRQPEVA